MTKADIYRWLRLIGIICTTILAVIGALGVDIPPIQDGVLTGAVASIGVVLMNGWNHWKNNNYTAEAKVIQPQLDELKAMRGKAGGEGTSHLAVEHEANEPKE